MTYADAAKRNASILPTLATFWFYLAGLTVLGFFALYIFRGFGVYALIQPRLLSNYWGVPLLFAGSLLQARSRDGWWLGMTLGGYFLMTGFAEIGSGFLQVFVGEFSLQTFNSPATNRFLFGLLSLVLLTRKPVLNVFFKPPYGERAPQRLRLAVVAGAAVGLAQIVVQLFVWPMVTLYSDLMTEGAFRVSAVLADLFDVFVPSWPKVTFTYAPLALIPLGAQLLKGRRWALWSALVLWSFGTSWAVLSLTDSFTTGFLYLSLMHIHSPIFSVAASSTVLYWLLTRDVLAHFGYDASRRTRTVGLVFAVLVGSGCLIALSKYASIPVLQKMFYF